MCVYIYLYTNTCSKQIRNKKIIRWHEFSLNTKWRLDDQIERKPFNAHNFRYLPSRNICSSKGENSKTRREQSIRERSHEHCHDLHQRPTPYKSSGSHPPRIAPSDILAFLMLLQPLDFFSLLFSS